MKFFRNWLDFIDKKETLHYSQKLMPEVYAKGKASEKRRRKNKKGAAMKEYDDKMVQITDSFGHVLTGEAEVLSFDYCLHKNCQNEDGIMICNHLVYSSQIKEIKHLPDINIIRATETWQKAGAYYVRIQAMAKKHHISLKAEFDNHDTTETKYIVVTDNDFPIATARMYPIDKRSMMIGRVVVLPEYRHRGIGRMVIYACEKWAKEMCFAMTIVESRDNKIGFYETLGYEATGETIEGETFRCIRMKKEIMRRQN